MIKAIFFDIDGTLLSRKENKVPQSAKDSLSKLREKGIKIFLSTGRSIVEVEKLPIHDLEFDGYIILNGQICLDSEKSVVCSNPIGKEETELLVSIYSKKQIPMLLVEEVREYMNYISPYVVQMQKEENVPEAEVREYEGNPVYQFVVFMDEEEDAAFLPFVPQTCKMTRWGKHGVDIIPAEGGKVKGIKYFQEILGIKADEIMAFGDAHNDIDMLSYAGIGVAMGNAADEVKAIADYVTTDIDDDGIQNALKKYKII